MIIPFRNKNDTQFQREILKYLMQLDVIVEKQNFFSVLVYN